jgi:hypothetical protein
MTLHDVLLLLGGVVALYLYDSALLLYHNEIVVVSARSGCRVSGGSTFELRGRHVFLPNPLCPHRSLFRLNWPEHGQFSGAARPVPSRRVVVALSVLAPWMLLLLFLFAVALPYTLLVMQSAQALLAWIATVYTAIILSLFQVYRYRKALNLSGRAVAAIALDALLCAPFALNIVRKIGLRQRFDDDLRVVAATRLSPQAVRDLAGILDERIQASLQFVEPDAPAFEALKAYLHHFERLRE